MLSSVDDLRVLIVAGDPLAHAGLATWLADQPGFIVVGQGARDADLPAEVAVYRPTWWYGTWVGTRHLLLRKHGTLD